MYNVETLIDAVWTVTSSHSQEVDALKQLEINTLYNGTDANNMRIVAV